MKCRIDITGQKTWIDNNNEYNTRPATTEIQLLRDEVVYRRITLDSFGDGTYTFPCLIDHKNTMEQYIYSVDEQVVPPGYLKIVQGNNIVNVLENITIEGNKTWDDNFNEAGYRPQNITVRLLQNNSEIAEVSVPSPEDSIVNVNFILGEFPFADPQGVPYVYTLAEDPVDNYITTINGLNITNILSINPFSFTKTSSRSTMALDGAVFELLQNGTVLSTATSDSSGLVSFLIPRPGNFQLQEKQPPAGFMEDVTVYQVNVTNDGIITVDGMPASEFEVKNKPVFFIERATSTVQSYMNAPNSWSLHGTGSSDFFMTDKILITANVTPNLIKWDDGVRDIEYFKAGGGFDVTAQYANGIPVNTNGNYSVYALLQNGYETVLVINIDRIRDGSAEFPWLLVDYTTASSLNPILPGIGQFTADFMQGEEKLSKNYELYEDIDLSDKEWMPLGLEDRSEGFTGSLDGNGHSIINMILEDEWDQGFFRVLKDGAYVQNLGIIDSEIKSMYNSGLVAAHVIISDGGTVSLKNLRTTGKITNNGYAGGVVGVTEITNGSLIMENCNADVNITSETGAGILAQCSLDAEDSSVMISKCYAKGSMDSEICAGIVGLSSVVGNLTIENCVNSMSFTSANDAGGIAALFNFYGNGTALISSCYNVSNITAVSRMGGIVGEFQGSAAVAKVENCYNSGSMTITDVYSFAGGIVGKIEGDCSIQNSYNTGNIIFSNSLAEYDVFIGGISGNYGNIKNCVSMCELISNPKSLLARISPSNIDSTVSSLNNNAALNNMQVLINGVQKYPLDIGLSGTDGLDVSASQIKSQSLYQSSLGWDLTNAWRFGNENYTLPVLRGIPLDLQPAVLPSHLN